MVTHIPSDDKPISKAELTQMATAISLIAHQLDERKEPELDRAVRVLSACVVLMLTYTGDLACECDCPNCREEAAKRN